MYERFSDLLQKHKVSTYKVAKATGISQQTFSDWKIGKSTPKVDKLQKIADFFDVPLEYFIGENAEKNSTPPVQDERGAAIEFVKGLSDLDFDRYSSVIRAVFPDKFEK